MIRQAASRTATRRMVLAAAYAGGGVVLGGATLFGVLRQEAALVRRRILSHHEVIDPPDGSGYWGSGAGEPLVLAMLGDSSAVGRGVDDVAETPGVLLAVALSELADRPVRLVQVAVSGSESSGLALQVGRVTPEQPDIAVVMIGANDVTARVPPKVAVRNLRRAVLELRVGGSEVVVGTCPDLGTLRPVPQPLRRFGRYWSRQMAAAQTVAAVEAGARSVSLGSILGAEFANRPEYFSADQYHPSSVGYARAAAVMLPSIADALGLTVPEDLHMLPARTREVRRAAAKAADRPGTEVSAAPDRRGRAFALSLRRRPARMPTPAEVSDADRQSREPAS